VLINKRVCDRVTYSTSIDISFQPCAHMYIITCGQPESFCLSEKYLLLVLESVSITSAKG